MLIGRRIEEIDSAHSLRRIAAVASAASGARGIRAASVRMVRLGLSHRLDTVERLLFIVWQGPSELLAGRGIWLHHAGLSCLFLGLVPGYIVNWDLMVAHHGHLLLRASKQRESHFRLLGRQLF